MCCSASLSVCPACRPCSLATASEVCILSTCLTYITLPCGLWPVGTEVNDLSLIIVPIPNFSVAIYTVESLTLVPIDVFTLSHSFPNPANQGPPVDDFPLHSGVAGQQQQPHEVFRKNLSAIHTAIRNSAQELAREAYSQGLIPEEVCTGVSGQLTANERAAVFLQALESSIRCDPTCLKKFVSILRKSDPVYYSLLIDILCSS